MSTKHAIAAARFLENKENEAWHDHTLWMVRTKRDKMSHSLPEWERLRELASEIKLYSNSHLDTLQSEERFTGCRGVREKCDRQRGYRALGERCRGA